jgi:hypothetical protein
MRTQTLTRDGPQIVPTADVAPPAATRYAVWI